MRDYGAQLSGFPPESGNDLEKSIKAWMTEKFNALGGGDLAVVGLSMSWDILEKKDGAVQVIDDVQNLLDKESAQRYL